jgi:threonine dehydrogenase-like Zn-dependent dehydrogenase
MKGIVFEGPGKIKVKDFEIPEPGKGEVLIKMKSSGICGSDMHVYRGEKVSWSVDLSKIPGHEPCGVVEELGEGVNNLEVGDRVLVYHFEGCGNCHFCLEGDYQYCKELSIYGGDKNGGDSEYMVANTICCLKLPEELSYIEGSLLACNVGTSYEAIKQLGLSALHTVVVYGLGPVGIAAVMLSKAMGGQVIGVDIIEKRVEMGLKTGVDLAINALKENSVERITEFTKGKGADMAIECSGSPQALNNSLDCVKPYGRVALVGVGLKSATIKPLEQILLKQTRILGIRMFNIRTYPEMVNFIIKNKVPIEKIVSNKSKLENAQEAFDLFDTGETGKIVFTF